MINLKIPLQSRAEMQNHSVMNLAFHTFNQLSLHHLILHFSSKGWKVVDTIPVVTNLPISVFMFFCACLKDGGNGNEMRSAKGKQRVRGLGMTVKRKRGGSWEGEKEEKTPLSLPTRPPLPFRYLLRMLFE